MNIKEKAKKVWEENKTTVIGIGTGIVAIGVAYTCAHYKGYKAGFIDGGVVGADIGIQWLDKEFPETNAVKLMNDYKAAHPEEIVHRIGKGKWA